MFLHFNITKKQIQHGAPLDVPLTHGASFEHWKTIKLDTLTNLSG